MFIQKSNKITDNSDTVAYIISPYYYDQYITKHRLILITILYKLLISSPFINNVLFLESLGKIKFTTSDYHGKTT